MAERGLQGAQASVAAAREVSGCGSQALEHRPCGTQALSPQRVEHGSGIEPVSPALTGGFFTITTTGTPTAKQADSVKQFYQENVQNESTCLVFLNSEKDICLGTLIHKQWVLTAAHCFLPFLEMEIAISDEQFQKRMESLRPMLIIPHPNFKQDSAEHDIALIKLTHPLKLSDQIFW
ncbi:hypothetical protein MJG53_003092 [Ovis ammon polii x Ovis aries]|uniref:Uncharacterized protein n=1 Tax=Ovis ammon polii x Ovis aries TaxID=2918886 RepID=A0ACB9VGN8_9CETA|nr:hypothetical protein MJT46_004441 [Ovis ammon polii x Ovis aries]KAI4588684.1 hypothetical protein MJG53_003092 [Ovis ammon polii x Ovis aries]